MRKYYKGIDDSEYNKAIDDIKRNAERYKPNYAILPDAPWTFNPWTFNRVVLAILCPLLFCCTLQMFGTYYIIKKALRDSVREFATELLKD